MVRQSLDTLFDLFTRPEFLGGLALGLPAAGVVAALRRVRGAWALSFVAAGAAAVWLTVGRRLAVTVGLTLLALAGYWMERRRPVALASAVVGAALLTMGGGVPSVGWVGWGLFSVVLIGGLLGRDLDLGVPSGWVGLVISISTLGIWVTVPDTDLARIMVGVALPLAPLTGICRRPLGPGLFALVGLLAWAAAVGGGARPASIIGGWLALGILLLAPLISSDRRLGTGWILAIHAGLVLVATRVIGLGSAAWPAALGGVFLLAVGLVVVAALRQPAREGESIG